MKRKSKQKRDEAINKMPKMSQFFHLPENCLLNTVGKDISGNLYEQ